MWGRTYERGSSALPIAVTLTFVAALSALSFSQPARGQSLAGSWEGEIIQPRSWPTFIRLEVDASNQASLKVLGQALSLGEVSHDRLDSVIGEGSASQRFRAKLRGNKLVGTLESNGANATFKLARVPDFRTTDRIRGWNADLSAITSRVLHYDRSYSADEKARVQRQIAQLRPRIAATTDDAMRVHVAKLLAEANNAHTRLYLLRNRTELARLPIRVWWFAKQLRVIRAGPGHEQLLGCRIVGLNGVNAEQAYARVQMMYAGSSTWKRYMSQYTLTAPSILAGAGIGKDPTRAVLSLQDCTARRRQTLEVLPFDRSEKPVESWWDLAPQSPSELKGWSHVLDNRQQPLYLSSLQKAYWFREAVEGIFYLQLNRAANSGNESVSAFAVRASQAIARAKPKTIVVDLRFNTGGDSNITSTLVEKLVAAAGTTPMSVLVGRATFSAGIVAAAQLRSARSITVVGEPPGDELDFWAEGGNIVLPYSGLTAHFANGAHSLSKAPCPSADYCNDLSVSSLAPDVFRDVSWSDYLSGRDPLLASGKTRPRRSR